MSTIDFSHLKLFAIFVSVVESRSFAAAARKLLSSRSRISEQVAKLEVDLGVRLLQRSTRQLRLTPEGQQVYEQVRHLPEIIKGVEATLTSAEPSGRVSITMTHDTAHKYLLASLPDFQEKYPKLQLDLILRDDKVDLINAQIDLAIRIGIPKDESLIARQLHEERLGIFASIRFLEKFGRPKKVSDLEQYPWILLDQIHHRDIQLLQHRGQTLTIKPKRFYRCNSPLMVQNAVSRGLGLGVLLPTMIRKEIEDGFLQPILPTVRSEPMIFSLVYPSRKQVPLRVRTVIDYLLSEDIFI